MVGITGVGTWVVAAIAFLAAGGPDALPGADATASDQVAAVAAVIGAYILVSLPFDLLGGLILPRRHGRACPGTDAFVVAWARGVLVQAIATGGAVLAVVAAGRAGGTGAAVGVIAALALAIGISRVPLARLVADLPVEAPAAGGDVLTVGAEDPGFTGGISGTGTRMLLPRAWDRALGQGLAVERARRQWAIGAPYVLGLVLAAAWTTAGAALSFVLPDAGVQSAGQVVAAGAWFTLWSFVGLLVLPSVSRPAVYAADAAALREHPAEEVARVIRALDALQDDEPERPGGVEVIFHPIPSAGRRIRRLGQAAPAIRPWHVARLALPMSWCLLGLLGRAVHCNAGRPDLWVLLPSD